MHSDMIDKVAYLARLRIDPAEKEKFSQAFDRVLGWISQLNELDTTLVQARVSTGVDHMSLRDDRVTQTEGVEDILQNAPVKDYQMFGVPKVVE